MDLKNWDWSRPTVKAVVGSEKNVFYIHASALSCRSPVWKSRLEGSWQNDERDIDWTEFDLDTIQCVLSFLYKGDYNAIGSAGEEHNSLDQSSNSASDDSTSITVETSRLLILHSKVYAFAAQFLCPELKECAQRHLALTLERADPRSSDVLAGVLEAVGHIYEQTMEEGTERESARVLLMKFLVHNLEHLGDVNVLLTETHEITKDLLRETLERLKAAEGNVAMLYEAGFSKDKDLQDTKERLRIAEQRANMLSNDVAQKDREIRELEDLSRWSRRPGPPPGY